MDTRTLTLALVLGAAALSILILVLAIFRKDRGLWIYAIGFLGGVIGFLLLTGQGVLSPWLSFIAANMLIGFFHICLAFGLRTWSQIQPQWPFRFWAYLAVWLAILIAGTFFWTSYHLRAIGSSILIIWLTLEFLIALRNSPRVKSKAIRLAAWLLGLSFCVNHLVRIVMILWQTEASPQMMNNNLANGYTLSFTIFYSILWAGAIMIIDVAGLLQELGEKNRILNDMATTDKLTGLSNRYVLETKVASEIERAMRYGQPLSIILFDLDHFKLVNDTWGHHMGDIVLKQTAGIIQALIREPDNLFRWGGEEFMILAPHTSKEGAFSLADKVRQAMAAQTYPNVGPVSASFGVAEWNLYDSHDLWFKKADYALYRAKNAGRNQVVAWDEADILPIADLRLEWHKEWESGHPGIDRQHRELLELTNHLLDLSLSDGSQPLVLEKLNALLQAIEVHFADEELELRKSQYPDLAEHADLHQKLLVGARELRASTASQGADPSALFNFLIGRVVMGHILKVDVRYFPFTRRKAD